jgi:hypothetical protein
VHSSGDQWGVETEGQDRRSDEQAQRGREVDLKQDFKVQWRARMEAEERRKSRIPSMPLNEREQDALPQLSKFQPGERIGWRDLKAGIATTERIELRGYIVIEKPKRCEPSAWLCGHHCWH